MDGVFDIVRSSCAPASGCGIFAVFAENLGKGEKDVKRILLLSQFFFPDRTGTGRVMGELFSSLSENGFSVDVIASRQEYGDVSGRVLPAFETYGDVRVFRCFRWFRSKENAFGRVFNYVMVVLCSLWTAIHHGLTGKKDIIVSVSNPPLMPFLGLLLRRKGQRFIYILHDLYPDIAIAMHVVGEKHLFSRVMFAVNRYVFRHADKVVVLGRDMEKYLMTAYHVPETHLAVIENWASDGVVFRRKEQEGRFKILYTGNMGRFHNLELAVEALRELPEATLVFVGEGASKAGLMEQAREMENVEFRSFLPEAEYQEALAEADAFLVSLEEDLSGLAVPSKFYTYLAAGRPVLAISDPMTEMAMTIRENRLGFVLPHGDVGAFCAAVDFLQAHPQEACEMGERARKLYLEKYRKETIVRKYAELFMNM